MADNPSNGNFTNYGIILATLLSAGALLFPGFPGLDTRPPSAAPPVHETASAQDTDARLWQDPFEVVKVAKKPSPCTKELGRYTDHHCNYPIKQLQNDGSVGESENAVYVGVTLSGAPYPEDEEARRQYRYAVVSGLDVLGYVPRNPQGIGYYLKPNASSGAVSLPTTVPFELFESKTGSAKKKIVLLWINEDLAAGRPLKYFCGLLKHLGLEAEGMQVVGPRTSDTLRDLVNEAKDPGGALAGCENGFQQSSFYAFSATVADSAVLSALGIPDKGSVHDYLEKKNIHLFRTVATDDVVADSLVRELKLRGVEPGREQCKTSWDPSNEARKSPPNEQHIALISEWDTFYGQTFPGTLQKSLQANLRCPDASAAGAKNEPNPPCVHKFTYLRGLDGALPGSRQDDWQHNADGDEKSDANKDQAAKNRTDTKTSDFPFGNGQFDYLRRLARSLRSLQDDLRRTNQGGIKTIGVLGTDVFDKLQVLRALKFEFPEAIFFTTDFDDAFTAEAYRNSTRNLIMASSFGPKLAEPLQGAIPPFRETYQTAAFLSTQIAVADAPVPRSRDSRKPIDEPLPLVYEAGYSADEAAEASTKASAAEPATTDDRLPRWPSRDKQDDINKWLNKPPIFEIERTGNLLQLPQHSPQHGDCLGPSAATKPRLGASAATQAPPRCDDPRNLRIFTHILPSDPPLFPSLSFPVRLGLVFILGGLFLYAFRQASRYRATLKRLQLKACFHQNPRRLTFADATYWIYTLLFGFLSGLGIFLLLLLLQWPWFASWLTSDGDGEPMHLSEGASLWPSIGLRLATMILSLSFIFLAWAQLESNINKVARLINLKSSPRLVINTLNRDVNNSEQNLIRKIYKCFIVEARSGQTRDDIYIINESWDQFVFNGRPFAQFCRVTLSVGVAFAVTNIMFSITGKPEIPGRGELVRNLYLILSIIDVILMYFLIFLVVDATLFSFFFVRQLAKGPTLWPESTKKFFKKKLGLDQFQPPKEKSGGVFAKAKSFFGRNFARDRSPAHIENHHQVLDDWIDLYFIGKRTACINELIYYPFAVIALMIVSRSAVFGDFPLSKPIIIFWGVCLAIVVGCAIALNHAAEDARTLAQKRLMDEIIKSKGSPASGRSGQWESLLDRVNALRDGAFRPFLQQPLFGAILLPLTSVGWATALEKGLFG